MKKRDRLSHPMNRWKLEQITCADQAARLRLALGGRAFAYPGHAPLAVTIRANSL
jgi:hypothetical protein